MTTAPSASELEVVVHLDGVDVPAGRAAITGVRPTTTLRYTGDYLGTPGAYAIDPQVPLDDETHVVDGLPLAFADAAPDWWGRTLLRRAGGTVGEVGPLVAAHDVLREGALRFREPGAEAFLAAGAAPAVDDLEVLLAASDTVVRNGPDADAAARTLVAAGAATLGGARPKGSVRDGDALWVVKFPDPVGDEWDVLAWEKTALDLAQRAGLPVPASRLVRVDGRAVLLLARFDREQAGQACRRVGYVSAGTLLGDRTRPTDYRDVGAAIERHSGDPAADLRDLYRRIAFSVAIHNTDDHMRNLAFLHAPEGWRLSPVYDVNTEPDVDGPRTTAILGETRRAGELDALLEFAPHAGLGGDDAVRIVDEVLQGVEQWRDVATRGIGEREIEHFASAYDGIREQFAARR